jgi:hypothetical protein
MVAILDVCQGHQTYLGKRAIQELSYAQLSKMAVTKFERKKRLQRACSGSPELLTHHLLHITTMKWPSWKVDSIPSIKFVYISIFCILRE